MFSVLRPFQSPAPNAQCPAPIARSSKPEVLFATCLLSHFSNSPTPPSSKGTTRVLDRLDSDDSGGRAHGHPRSERRGQDHAAESADVRGPSTRRTGCAAGGPGVRPRSMACVRTADAQVGIVSANLHGRFVAGHSSGAISRRRRRHLRASSPRRGCCSTWTSPTRCARRHGTRSSASRRGHLAAKRLDRCRPAKPRRVLIARALVSRPRALVLDEPTTGLDLVARHRFLETVRRLASEGTTIVLITHHVEEIIPEIGQVVLLDRGRVAASGVKERDADGRAAVADLRWCRARSNACRRLLQARGPSLFATCIAHRPSPSARQASVPGPSLLSSARLAERVEQDAEPAACISPRCGRCGVSPRTKPCRARLSRISGAVRDDVHRAHPTARPRR